MNVVAQQSDARATRLAMSTHDTPQTDFHDMLLPQVVRGFASMFCLLPPTRLALGHLPMDRVPDASGLFNLMRNLGGAVGLALIDTIVFGRIVQHGDELAKILLHGDPDAFVLSGFRHSAQARSLPQISS
jgi:MFS transporter, DHA2 family, multidrug resistance protein